jgi:hypothetical protein
MKLPAYKTKHRPAHEQKQLAAWLAERELDLLLRDDKPGGEAASAAPSVRYDLARKPVDPLREGDIMLLRPAAKGAWSPVYVFLIDGSSNESWLGIPFSRYATPAVPGEWQTSFTAMPLRVLCFWNVRTVARSNFIPGAVKKCPPADFAEIKHIRDRIARGEAMDAREGKHFGPPLLHPADPRYEYLDEERKRLDDHLIGRVHASEADEEEDIITYDFRARGKTEWLLAAEGRPEYGKADEEVD